MPAKIPATVVTGFLGAGKTTLIRRMLANAGDRRIALIVNEFGETGVDGEILKGCGVEACGEDDIVELSNGCICCAVAEDFIPAMEKLLSRDVPPDHVVIETSGLALPQPLVRAFNWPEISTRVAVDAVVAVIDGEAAAQGRFARDLAAVEAQRAADENLDHETPLSELFEDQLACADIIVVNKTDLLDDSQASALTKRLAESTRSGASVLKANMGDLPIEVLLGQVGNAEVGRPKIHGHDDGHHHDHDHGHDEFESFVATRPEIADPEHFAERLSDTIRAHGILRLKGFAAVAGKPMRLAVQAAGPRVETYFDRPLAADEPRETRLVVIGRAGLDRVAIETALSA